MTASELVGKILFDSHFVHILPNGPRQPCKEDKAYFPRYSVPPWQPKVQDILNRSWKTL
jgi:hypothetical protein